MRGEGKGMGGRGDGAWVGFAASVYMLSKLHNVVGVKTNSAWMGDLIMQLVWELLHIF